MILTQPYCTSHDPYLNLNPPPILILALHRPWASVLTLTCTLLQVLTELDRSMGHLHTLVQDALMKVRGPSNPSSALPESHPQQVLRQSPIPSTSLPESIPSKPHGHTQRIPTPCCHMAPTYPCL